MHIVLLMNVVVTCNLNQNHSQHLYVECRQSVNILAPKSIHITVLNTNQRKSNHPMDKVQCYER